MTKYGTYYKKRRLIQNALVHTLVLKRLKKIFERSLNSLDKP